MAGHFFEPLFVDQHAGTVTVRWDGDDDRRMTCRIPLAADGTVASTGAFKTSILEQCVFQLELWDRLALADLGGVATYIGQTFDVTEAYVLRNIK